jgi:ABC-2 type transport system permease protein
VNSSLSSQLGPLARRSIAATLKQPLIITPTLIFPLFFLAVNVPGLEAATTRLKGFPTDDYLAFSLAFAFVQAGLAGVTTAGGALAQDIQNGFLSRLSLTPMKGAALIFGSLSGTVVLAELGAVTYIVVGLAFGAKIEAGIGGVAVLLLLTGLFALAFGSIGIFVALRTGNGEAVEAVFPLLFALFFLSSMAMPRNLIQTDWFKTFATYNPLSYMIEAVRSVLITGWDAEALALGGGIAVVVSVVAITLAATQISRRVLRT